MTSFIKKIVRECDICQRSKSKNVLLARKLQPLPIPSQVWTDLAMDFIEGLPKSTGKDTTFIVVDRLSKYAHFFALSHPFTIVRIAQIFFDNIFKLHGLRKTIVSDRDKVFVSTFWRELFALQGTKLQFSSAYHPQTDGQSKVTNRCLEKLMRCFTSTHPQD